MVSSTAPLLPPAGTPGVFDPRNPTLLPNFDSSLASSQGTVDHSSPASFLAANPRVDALATATIGGTVTTGDIVSLLLTNTILGGQRYGALSPPEIDFTYTTLSTDTTTTIAEALADLINDSTYAQELGVRADAVGAVITVHHEGPVGNFSTLTAPISGPSKITVGGTALTGDQLNVLFTGPALGPVTPATANAILAGTYATSDTVALTFTNTSIASLPVTKTYTVVAGDNANTVAAGLVALILADTTLQAAGISASAVNNVIAFTQQGAIGNSTVLSRSVSGSETVTFEPSNGHMGGGAGQPGGVLVQVSTTTAQSATTMGGNLATAINANSDLAAASITGSNSSGVVTLTVPAAAEPIGVTAWVNTITPVATITGAVAAADVLNLVFTAAYLPGGTHTVSHTALLGETTTTLATNLAAAINADAVMIAAGITAVPSSNAITISYQAAAGQIRFSQSVSPGSETITWTTAPTETIVVATKATETIVIGGSGTAVVAASATALVTGTTFNSGDTVAITFTNAGVASFPITKTYTLSGGSETAATIAAGLNTLINADTALQAANVSSTVSSATLTIKQQGTIGNSTVLSATIGGTGDEGITFTPSNGHMAGGAGTVGSALSGGSGPVLVTNNFTFHANGQQMAMWYGNPYLLAYPQIASMVAQGLPII